MSVQTQKTDVANRLTRQDVLDKRTRMTDHAVRQLSDRIQERVLKNSFWPSRGMIGLYAPIKNEVMTDVLFKRALESGSRVFFPKVEQGIVFYEVSGPGDLEKGSWGIPEPNLACSPLLPEESLDILIMPGLVFDTMGARLGYGKGFYDRYLASLEKRPLTIGLAYQFQISENVEQQSWDQTLDYVVTENSIFGKKL